MAEIKCPMCSKLNPAELDVCQYCEARLKPMTDELSRSQPPIHPGEEPTEKDTSELEPVLPQWLREVRKQARESVDEKPEQAPVEEEAPQAEESADLLAGLRSQDADDEEIPDWLTDLRGAGAQIAPEETPAKEDDLAALRSMLDEQTTGGEEKEASALPGWISDLGAGESESESGEDELSAFLAESPAEEPSQTEAQPAASGTDFEWTADFETDSGPQAVSAEDEAPIETDLPAWLQGADEASKSEAEIGLPDWMRTEEPSQATPPFESEGTSQPFSTESDAPDWLSKLGEETTETAPEQSAQPAFEGDLPDWLASLGDESTEPSLQQEREQPTVEGETPSWLASLGEESAEDVSLQEEAQPAARGETPDWLASFGAESAETASLQEETQPPVEGAMPDWLAVLGGESAEAPTEEEIVQPTAEGDMPDWLSSMAQETAGLGESTEEAESPAFVAEEPAQEAGVPPAFVDDEGGPLSADVDAFFSMEMPDWLSSSPELTEEETPASSVEAQGDDLSPAELPSWVQAMRPVEAVISDAGKETATDQYVEETGPLAGLYGVLPAVTGVGPSSIPKAYSIKLQASEDQQSAAAMLEQMLSAEVQPVPITTQPIALPQRFLRWIIAIVLLAAIAGSIFTGTQMNPLPGGVPPETFNSLRYIQASLPTDAPVLLIFDYEAARTGELEAAAAPLIDYMILQKAPRLSLISSTPTGIGLAERFMSLGNTQAAIYYQAGGQFVNLGYLPGGAAGVLAFARDPLTTKPVSVNGENAWGTLALQGVDELSDFAAIILLTDTVETARIWIEQTETERGDAHFLVVSSAQSGPMILPYVQSGQVDAMVTGLDGGAPIEQFNGGRPGTARRYWDAYGLGLLVALAMIAFGSLWSLVSGWRERRREQGEA